jgi:hypothetical protein
MVWQTPTPIGCTVKSNDPKYIVRVLLYRFTFSFDQINLGSGEYIRIRVYDSPHDSFRESIPGLLL